MQPARNLRRCSKRLFWAVIPTAGQKFLFATSAIASGSLTAVAKRSAVSQTTERGAHDAHLLRNGEATATLLK